jgi:hypothetical protein
MKFFLGLLVLIIGTSAQAPAQPNINNNNVDDGNDARSEWRGFLADNRIPPWSLVQRSIWGTRFFFKRAVGK